MELIKASINNISTLREICIQAYSQNFHHHWNKNGLEWYLEKEFSINNLEKELAKDYVEYSIVYVEGLSVGFVKVNHKSNLPNLSKEEGSELEKIYVLPKYKGLGIGKFVINEISKRVKNRGKEIFFLCVIDSNKSGIGFYEKLGFKFHSKTKLDLPYFKEELRGMNRMYKKLKN